MDVISDGNTWVFCLYKLEVPKTLKYPLAALISAKGCICQAYKSTPRYLGLLDPLDCRLALTLAVDLLK